MDYKVLDWIEANDMRQKEATDFVMTIEDNLAKVYMLADSSYLIIPVGPFAKCLITKDKTLLLKWMSDSYYPTEEKANDFYRKNREKIDNFSANTEPLIKDLYEYVNADTRFKNEYTKPCNVDDIYKLLKSKRQFNRYKLHFVALVGSCLIQEDNVNSYLWGLLKSKLLLNPLTTIVLVKMVGGAFEYFDLEYLIDGKWGYLGSDSIMESFKSAWRKPNELMTIDILK